VSAKSDTSDEGRAGSLSPALPVRRTSRPLHNSNSSSHINNNKKRNSTSNINHSAGREVMGSRRQNDNLNVIRKISVQAGAGPRVLEAKKPLTVKGS
jgi:hypothetical protein